MDERERVLIVTKMKDAPTPEPMGFKLVQVTLPWLDDEGNPETSVVLVPTGAPVAPRKDHKATLTKNQKLALEALNAALRNHGIPPPWAPDPDGPNPPRVVHADDWRQEFYARHSGTQEAKKKAFQRTPEDLVQKQAVGQRDDYYWPIPEHAPPPGDPSAIFQALSRCQL